LLELGIGRPEQWHVIPLGLELDRHFAVRDRSGAVRDELGLGGDDLLVGMVGRLVPIKDPETMLRAFALVPDAHLAVIGDGELRERTEALARQLGIADRVHHLGWRFDMPAVLADLDLVALSSRNEGTPLTIIEAAACGVPAVATDVGGVASVVRDGATGLLVPPEDPVALAAALGELLGDEARRRELGHAARDAAGRYRAERLVGDVSALYRSLLA
jgi:glycosyltransferase involved in cell wall biosynthesis